MNFIEKYMARMVRPKDSHVRLYIKNRCLLKHETGEAAMNKGLLKGASMYSLGWTQEMFGRLLGNNRLQIAGVHRQVRGKCQIAVGDAQRIIRHCLKQQGKPAPLGLKPTNAA
jgi:uncharacterized protein YjbJ (UPF0337 family)